MLTLRKGSDTALNKDKKGAMRIFTVVWITLIVGLLAAVISVGLAPWRGESESIREVMRDLVLHDRSKIRFFGLQVNPAVISAYTVTGVLLFAALLIRIFAVPRFKTVPGKFQAVLEKAVDFFGGMAEERASRRVTFVSAYTEE